MEFEFWKQEFSEILGMQYIWFVCVATVRSHLNLSSAEGSSW